MKSIIQFYRGQKGSKMTKFLRLLLIFTVVASYCYFVLIWQPETFVSVLGTNKKYMLLQVIIVVFFSIYLSIQLDMKFLRRENKILKQIREFQMWNKFILHFAFLKTGSHAEKDKVIDSLKYLEDGQLKDDLERIYEARDSLKTAHSQIYDRYPYPQIKTFFSEAEHSIVAGVDEKALMQKTALNIDKYVSDLVEYEEAKAIGYKTSISLIVIVLILLAASKVLMPDIINGFTSHFTGFLVVLIVILLISKLVVKAKKDYVAPLVIFGGDDNE